MRRRAPFVDIVLGPQTYHRLPEMVAQVARATRMAGGVLDTDFPAEAKFDLLPEEAAPQGPAAFLTVQEGCDKFCTFCVVPYTRGAEYSRPVASVLAEARRLVDGGAREITLLGQNVNAYHGEAPRWSGTWGLGRLIRALAEIDGLERIRYTTSHPRDMDDDLIAAHRDVPALMPYLHLPVQAGSDRILAAMNRRHTRRRLSPDRRPAARGAARPRPVVGLHRRLPRRDRRRLRGDAARWSRRSATPRPIRSSTARVRARPAADARRPGARAGQGRAAGPPAGPARRAADRLQPGQGGPDHAGAVRPPGQACRPAGRAQPLAAGGPRRRARRAARRDRPGRDHRGHGQQPDRPPGARRRRPARRRGSLTSMAPAAPDSASSLSLEFDDNRLMTALCGDHDEHLARLEQRLGVSVHARGNRLTISGTPDTAESARRALTAALRPAQGRARRRPRRGRRGGAAGPGRRGPGAGRPGGRQRPGHQDAEAAGRGALARPGRRISARCTRHELVFGLGPAGTGKTYLAVAMARGADAEAGQVDRIDPVAPGGRGRRAAGLPARRPAREGRPLPAPALRRAVRHAAGRAGGPPPGERRDRGRAARLHARAHAVQRLRHPRRGAEHHADADEDVADPPGRELAHGGDRRPEPGRPAARHGLRPARRARRAAGRRGRPLRPLRPADVVRHDLVSRIVHAYEAREGEQPELDFRGDGRARAKQPAPAEPAE